MRAVVTRGGAAGAPARRSGGLHVPFSGYIRDPSGAVVPGVAVTLTYPQIAYTRVSTMIAGEQTREIPIDGRS